VAFSGGLDSSTVAQCAKRHADVLACAAFAKNSVDARRVKESADALDIPLVATELTKENVGDALLDLDLPFAPTLMDRGLWCLYRIVSRKAHDSGARVLLLGQLADELFGGYAKYEEAVKRDGEEAARSKMEVEVREYANRGRIRDVAACSRWVEPRFPFESQEIVRLALSLPLSYKIRGGVRKAVLRRAARILGVPETQAGAAKKAAQYSSGVQKLVLGSRF
jgi:asparagine synthase (glutamine-hydrolysing)